MSGKWPWENSIWNDNDNNNKDNNNSGTLRQQFYDGDAPAVDFATPPTSRPSPWDSLRSFSI